MLEAYFDGDSIENDAINICSEDQIQNHDEAPEISRVLDYDLKQELYLIDLEFAAMGKWSADMIAAPMHDHIAAK